MAKTHVKMTVNGRAVEGLVEPRRLLDPLPARGPEPDGRPHRLRYHPLRRLHGRSRRQVGEELHHVRGAGRGRQDHHHRGHGQCRRLAAPAAGGLPHEARAAVRLLHARHDHARPPPAAGEPQPRPRTRSASASPATCAAARAIRTSSRPFSTRRPRSAPRRARRLRNDHGHPHARSSAKPSSKAWAASASGWRTSASPRARATTSTT